MSAVNPPRYADLPCVEVMTDIDTNLIDLDRKPELQNLVHMARRDDPSPPRTTSGLTATSSQFNPGAYMQQAPKQIRPLRIVPSRNLGVCKKTVDTSHRGWGCFAAPEMGAKVEARLCCHI